MMPLRIIDNKFNLLAEIDNYESLIFTRRYYKLGEFELHININKNNADMLQKDNIIIIGNNGHKAGIIRYREIKVDENGKQSEILIVKGSTLSSFMGRRITIPPEGQAYDQINSQAESVMKHYVTANCVAPTDIKRRIPELITGIDKGRGKIISYQSRLKQLDIELEAISLTSEVGWEIFLDLTNKKYVFDIIMGRNLTASQDILPPVIFSVDFDNIKSQHFVDSSINYKNKGYVGGQGEGENRSLIEVGDDVNGLDRIESFIDARDINENESLVQRGEQKLRENSEIATFESEILPNNSFKYGIDWDIGDIVTVLNRSWNVTLDSRITEVKEIYEAGGFRLEATFGNNIPTFIDKLKNTLDKPLVETPVNGNYDDRYYTKTEVDAKVTETVAPTFIFTQIAPSNTWTINHNLKKRPSVSIVDSAGSLVIGDLTYTDANNLTIRFSAAFAGYAYLN